MPKTTRRSSMQQAMQNISKHTFNSEVRLQMECTEEELQPCQKLSFKQAYDEFNRINKYINDVQTGRATISPNMPNSTTTMLNEPAKPIPSSQNQSDPDVIVVGESPPQAKKAVSSKLPSLPGNLTLPPLPNSNQSVLAFPQQVYKFVNGGQQSDMVKVGNRFFIRPIMPVAPQQNVAMQNTATRPVSMLKRSVEFDTDRKMASKREMDESGNWVPLDEFYYGKKEGDPTYTEDKGEYRFKCWYCSKMLYNNVKTMMHMQGHIDSEKQQNLDLSDLTQCKHCYKQFDTPFEMQTHIEKVHMYNSNVLMCRICEKDCDSRITLTTHMRSNHNACEMPYMCQLCGFRSSMYSDVVDHFKKKHDSSANLLCLYCLKSFNIKFISTGWGQTQNYYHHLLKHQSKNKVRKCQVCKLTFFNPQDVKSHRQKDHLPNLKGVKGMNSKYTTPDQVMIKVPEQGLQPKPIKSLNAPIISKVRDNHLLLPGSVREVNCLECKLCMSTPDHYKKYIQCSMCRFATSCSFAYANHMMGFHSGQITSISLNIPKERPMEHIMYCMCGYASKYGNNIANHMVYCTKRTCYKEKPDVPVYDYENKEIQDPRKKPGASLLDVLGLVKKTSASIQSSSPSTSSSGSSRGKKSSSWFRIKLDPKKNDEKTSKDEEDLDSSSEKDEVSENKKNTSEDSILIDDSVKDNDSKNISVKDDISDIAPKDDLSKESISNDDPKASQDKLSEDKVSVPKEDVDQNPKDKVTTDSEQNQKSAKTLGEIVKETETSVSKNATSQDNATLPSTESVDDMDTSEIEQTKSPANDTLEEINKTCAENDKSSDNMTNSSTSDSKPTETEQEPIEEDAKPTRAEQEAETEQEPTEEDAKPTEAEQEATEEDAKPIEGEQEPTEEDAKSTEAEQEATKEDAKPIEGEQEPTEEDAKPTEAEQESMEEGSSKSEALDTNVSDSPDVHAQSEKDSVPESIPQKLEDLSDISTETETKNSDISKKNKPEDTEDKPEDFIEDSLPHKSEVRDVKEKSSLIQEDKNIEEINQESIHSEEKKSEETKPDAAQKISGDPDQETSPGTSKDSTQITQTTDEPVHEDSNLEGTQSQTQSSASEASASKSSDRSNSRRDSEDRHRHSDDLSRSYDREREYRNRDRNRDRSHRDDYRDRSRDQHYDRDRKYDRDYDRHGRDRNRDYGNHGNQSNRDYRRNDYHGRDRDRDYDNRNYNRRGKGQGYQDNRDRRYY